MIASHGSCFLIYLGLALSDMKVGWRELIISTSGFKWQSRRNGRDQEKPYYKLASAWVKSVIRSSISSIPTDILSIFSLIPIWARSCGPLS